MKIYLIEGDIHLRCFDFLFVMRTKDTPQTKNTTPSLPTFEETSCDRDGDYYTTHIQTGDHYDKNFNSYTNLKFLMVNSVENQEKDTGYINLGISTQ